MHHSYQERLNAARARTDELFALVDPRYLYERPVPERHRLIFYLGHVDAFDWNQIAIWNLSHKAVHPEFDHLFSRGIDPDSGDLPTDRASDWPGIEEVLRYREQTRRCIDHLLPNADSQVIEMALEHRLMHAETLAYLLHSLPCVAKEKQPQAEPAAASGIGETVEVEPGVAMLGQPRGEAFGWDNEFEAHPVEVNGFRMDAVKVTNGQYLQFVREGGPVPHFWVQHDGQWLLRGMFEEMPLPLDWPVYVTYEQAAQYAAWKGRSLPTEAEFQLAVSRDGASITRNYGFRRWDPAPVQAGELVGNGWEWTSTLFGPFPGFRPEPNYPGYSVDFFDGKHYVLKGASPRTDEVFLRPSFRNWFRPDYPYVYATFRCIDR